ncbi:MAG: PDZ domain-containing protein [bacterium]|nr:PDZ domain-containing protein [bacterium]
MEILSLSIVGILTQWVWPVFLFIFGLGAVVFVHELGHFLVAKAVGIKVERFAIGFGPRVCGYRGKETDYSLMLLPLGGYVKMLGQEDFEPLKEDQGEPDPRAYSSKSVGARFAVISAGVIMNVIFAAIMFVIIGMVGMPTPAPVIGATVPGSPASTAEITWLDDSGKPMSPTDPGYPKDQPKTLQPGDRMKTIDGDGLLISLLGRDITRFRRVLMQAVLSDVTDKYTLDIERRVNDKTLRGRVVDLGLKMSLSPSGTGSMLPSFGIAPATSTNVVRGKAYLSHDDEVFKNKDKVLAINGRKIEHNWDIKKIEKTLSWKPLQVAVERIVDGKTSQVDITVQPTIRSTKLFYLKDGEILRGKVLNTDIKHKTLTLETIEDGSPIKRTVSLDNLENTHYGSDGSLAKESLDILGMIPRLRVIAVANGSPAHDAGMQANDIIVRYGNNSAPTHLKLRELNKNFSADGAKIVVLRDGKELSLNIKPETRQNTALIGILIGIDIDHLVVAGVRENSPASDLKIVPGDVIEKINGQNVSSWADMLTVLSTLQDKDVTLTTKRGDQVNDNLTIPSLSKSIFDKSDYTCNILPEPARYGGLMDPKISRGPMEALAWGGRETMFFVTTSYATLRSLIMRTVSTKELSGPVGIGNMAIQAGRRSMLDFVYFMAIISVSLAVVNFLPFPVVDGGHAMFLIFEKIRGKPFSIRVMNVVQTIGLVMILMVFVFVTWQDIARLWS